MNEEEIVPELLDEPNEDNTENLSHIKPTKPAAPQGSVISVDDYADPIGPS